MAHEARNNRVVKQSTTEMQQHHQLEAGVTKRNRSLSEETPCAHGPALSTPISKKRKMQANASATSSVPETPTAAERSRLSLLPPASLPPALLSPALLPPPAFSTRSHTLHSSSTRERSWNPFFEEAHRSRSRNRSGPSDRRRRRTPRSPRHAVYRGSPIHLTPSPDQSPLITPPVSSPLPEMRLLRRARAEIISPLSSPLYKSISSIGSSTNDGPSEFFHLSQDHLSTTASNATSDTASAPTSADYEGGDETHNETCTSRYSAAPSDSAAKCLPDPIPPPTPRRILRTGRVPKRHRRFTSPQVMPPDPWARG